MLDAALTQLVAAAVSEAQRPLLAELAAARAELGEMRRELGELARGRHCACASRREARP